MPEDTNLDGLSVAPDNKVEVDLKDLREVVIFAISFGKAIDKGMADGKLDLSDLAELLPVLMKIGPAFEGINNIPVIIKSMTKEQANEFLAEIKQTLDLADDKLEYMIEDSLRIVIDIYMFYREYFAKKDA